MERCDFDGPGYSAAEMPQREVGKSVVESLSLSGDERILDVGCGDGLLSNMLAAKVPHGCVLGIDRSPSMIAEASARAARNATFIVSDAADLSPALGLFDVIFSNATIHWIEHPKDTFVSCRSMLSARGYLRMNFGMFGNNINICRAIRDAQSLPEFARHIVGAWPLYFRNLEYYEGMLSEIGFEHINLWKDDLVHSFPAGAHIPWIRQAVIRPFLAQLPAELRPLFEKEVIARFENGSRALTEAFVRINIMGR